jgi:hypothetical protein
MDAYRSVAMTTGRHTDDGRRSGALDLCRALARKLLSAGRAPSATSSNDDG